MNIKSTNPCTRCGKERIDKKTWTEEVATFFGTSTVVHTDTVCPDPECQKIVEERLETLKAKTEEIKQEKQKKIEIATAARKQKAEESLKK